MKIAVTHDDGTVVDITTGVQVVYDAVLQSIDWSSGFLDTEEMESVAKIGQACRFADFEKVFEEVAEAREEEEKRQLRNLRAAEAAKQSALDFQALFAEES